MNYITIDSLTAVADYKDYAWWKNVQAKVTAEYDRTWNRRSNVDTDPIIPVESFKAWYELKLNHVLIQLGDYSPISKEMYHTCSWLDLRRQQKSSTFSHTFKGQTVTYNKFTDEFLFMSAKGTDTVKADDLATYLGDTWAQYEHVKASRCSSVHLWLQNRVLSLHKCFDVFIFKDLVDIVIDYLESNGYSPDYKPRPVIDEECYDDDEE